MLHIYAPLPHAAKAGEQLSGSVSPLGSGLRKSPGCPCRRCNPDHRIWFVRRVRYLDPT